MIGVVGGDGSLVLVGVMVSVGEGTGAVPEGVTLVKMPGLTRVGVRIGDGLGCDEGVA